jgi:hypothetical protein
MRADPEGDLPFDDLNEFLHGGIVLVIEKVDQDRGIDQDHRDLIFL